MIENSKIMEMLQAASDEYVNFMEDCIRDGSIDKYKGRKVEVGDLFIYSERIKGERVKRYYKLLENNNELYFIECDKNGNLADNFDFKNEESLNSIKLKFVEYLINMTNPILD